MIKNERNHRVLRNLIWGATCLLLSAEVLAACDRSMFDDSFEEFSGAAPRSEDLSLAAGEFCAYTAGTNLLLIRSALALPNELIESGEVLVGADGIIQCAGCDCSNEDGYASEAFLNCPNVLTTPGFINAHEHLTFQSRGSVDHGSERYDHRHDWRTGDRSHTQLNVPSTFGSDARLWGEIRHLIGGATTVIGSGSARGMLRNLDRSNDRDGLRAPPELDYNTFPLGDSDGTLRNADCDYRQLPQSTEGDVYHAHMAIGIDAAARNEFLCATDSLFQPNLQHPGPMLVGALGITAADLPALQQLRASIVWSPRNNLDLYGMTTPIPLLINAEIPVVLGTDWVATGSMNLQRELACAQQYNTNALDGALSEQQLLAMVTSTTADEAGVGDQIGRIAVGYFADLTLFSASSGINYSAALNARPEDIVMTLKAGKPLHGLGALIDAMGYDEAACESMGAVVAGDCLSQHSLCLGREGNNHPSYAQLHESNQATFYPLYFCGAAPPDEPSCVASRDEGDGIAYTGVTTAADPDGDGIASAIDLCPTIFSPLRPVDGFVQADADGDGIGDFCDFEQPPADSSSVGGFIAGVTSAAGASVNITLNGDETIAVTANGRFVFVNELAPDQTYSVTQDNPNCTITNGDGVIADVDVTEIRINCSPSFSTVYEVKQQQFGNGDLVALQDLLVTACNPGSSINLQTVDGDANFSGTDFSGIYVFYPSADCVTPQVGDRVDVTQATVNDFFGEVQLAQPTFVVQSQNNALPMPVVITPEAVADLNEASALNAVLVEVRDVLVTMLNPASGPGESDTSGVFVTEGSLRIDNRAHTPDPFPEVGTRYQSIRGALIFVHESNRLEPRDANDLVLEAP